LANNSQSDNKLNVVILAAGLGTRMKSRRAKVLHELDGLPLITHVVRAANKLDPETILVVVGHQAEEVEQVVLDAVGEKASFVVQAKLRGTGDAVESARSFSKTPTRCSFFCTATCRRFALRHCRS